MRQLSFVQNNRPGDSRLPANRRAVRSWAARDPLGKTGQRLKRRRRRYKAPEIVYIDERGIEGVQSTNSPSGQQTDRDSSDSEPPSATSQHAPNAVFTPINYAPQHPIDQLHDLRRPSPPHHIAGHPTPSRHEAVFIAHNTSSQRADASAKPSASARIVEPIVIDSGKNFPHLVQQPHPLALPNQLEADHNVIQSALCAGYPPRWPQLGLENRTLSLGVPLAVKPLLSPPSAVSEPSQRVLANNPADLPPILPSGVPSCEQDIRTAGVVVNRVPGEARVNSFTAFALRHSNFSWSHNPKEGTRLSETPPKGTP